MNTEQLEIEREFDAVLATLDTAEILALRAEVKRLRAALTSICELPPYGYGVEMCAAMQGIARGGLQP